MRPCSICREIRFAGLAIEKDKESFEVLVQTLKAQQSERAARIESLNQELAESFEKIKAREADIENRKIESANLRETAKEKRQTVSAIAAKRTVLEQQTSELRQKNAKLPRRETIGLNLLVCANAVKTRAVNTTLSSKSCGRIRAHLPRG